MTGYAEENVHERLLTRKRDCLAAILEMTEDTNILVREEDAGRYIELMEKRKTQFETVYRLDEEIKALDAVSKQSRDAAVVGNEIKSLIQRIINIDKSNENVINKIMTGLRASMKGISTEKSLNYGYNNYIPVDDGVYFDKKN